MKIRETSRGIFLTAFTPFTIIMYTTIEKAAVSKMRVELALKRSQVMKEHRCGGGTGLSMATSTKTVRCSNVRNNKVTKPSTIMLPITSLIWKGARLLMKIVTRISESRVASGMITPANTMPLNVMKPGTLNRWAGAVEFPKELLKSIFCQLPTIIHCNTAYSCSQRVPRA